jgi:hypothetical protein
MILKVTLILETQGRHATLFNVKVTLCMRSLVLDICLLLKLLFMFFFSGKQTLNDCHSGLDYFIWRVFGGKVAAGGISTGFWIVLC